MSVANVLRKLALCSVLCGLVGCDSRPAEQPGEQKRDLAQCLPGAWNEFELKRCGGPPSTPPRDALEGAADCRAFAVQIFEADGTLRSTTVQWSAALRSVRLVFDNRKGYWRVTGPDTMTWASGVNLTSAKEEEGVICTDSELGRSSGVTNA